MLSFEDDIHQTSHKRYFLPTVEIKDYHVMINERNFFDQLFRRWYKNIQPVRNNAKTNENIRIIASGQGDDNTNGCLLDNTNSCLLHYSYFKENYKFSAIDLSKQQALQVVPKAIQQINFTANLDWAGTKKFKRNYFGFFTRICNSIVNVFNKFALLW